MFYAVMATFFPLLGGLIAGLFGCIWPLLSPRLCQIITTGFIFLSAVFSIVLFEKVGLDHEVIQVPLFSWLEIGNLKIFFSLYIDTLAVVMMSIVTLISALVHLYSIGYMARDPHISRFMAFLSLFTFFMLFLVVSSNLVQLFLGWEGVGFFSYLLIGFWYAKPEANRAAQKAFLMNRVADLAFIMALALIYALIGSFEISVILDNCSLLKSTFVSSFGGTISFLEIVCFLISIAAMGKSAQIGFHTWLADAMEGPTPVSALIHAATMVTAGVFLILRCSHLFESAPFACSMLVVIGSLTALFGSMVAMTQNDIKRVIAYSTCSQVGYMFFSAGLLGYAASIFHLCTHAFFKALLFLGAGSVIHAFSNEQDLWKMGGAARFIPVTYVLMWIGSLALMGIPFFSGYYSKETILEIAWGSSNLIGTLAFWLGLLSVLFTAFYSCRLLFLVFHGKVRADERVMAHLHESPPIMIIPLLILSIGAILGGYIGYGLFIENKHLFWGNSFNTHFEEVMLASLKFLNKKNALIVHNFPQIMAIMGFFLAFIFYIRKTTLPGHLKNQFPELYGFVYNKWFFDELYNVLFVKPAWACGNFFWKQGDRQGIDYGLNGISRGICWLSEKVRHYQTGFIPNYVSIMMIGLMVASTWGLLQFFEISFEGIFENLRAFLQEVHVLDKKNDVGMLFTQKNEITNRFE
ncbi:MAG: NADH-quinone oxidoreductase subunit L [Proteobacteria bacterium]|nr:NADH-quinone oxidoreductase subunit L [Pseudomonadota bacterium]